MQSKNEADKLSKTHHNENRAKVLVREDLNALLFEAIEKKKFIKVMNLTSDIIENNKSIDLKNLQAAISQADPDMIQLILPHCGLSKPSNLYIPKELVIKSGQAFENCVKLLLNWNFIVNPDSKEDEEFVYAAVENGYLPIVLQLLDHGVDVNMVSSTTGLNLLTIACLMKRHEIVETLLKHNADVNSITLGTNKRLNKEPNFSCDLRAFTEIISSGHNEDDLCNVTCLYIAVFNCDLVLTKLLLKYGAKIISDPKFFHLSYLALKDKRKDIFRLFLDCGVNVTDVGYQSETSLHTCIYSDFRRIFTKYTPDQDFGDNAAKTPLANGTHICLKTPRYSFVFGAIINEYRKIAQLFLDYNPDVHYMSSDSDTALHKATINDFDVKFIRILLKHNPPVNIVNGQGLKPFLTACKRRSKDRLEVIKALLDNNANVNCTDKRLMTPLHFTCYDCNLELVKRLLEKEPNPNAINDEGETPLHYACKHNSNVVESIIRLLLDHNVDIEIKLLLDNYVNVNHKDLEDSTPLHNAVKARNLKAVICLIENGANIDALDDNKQTPLQIAEKYLLDFHNQLERFQSSTYLYDYHYHMNGNEYEMNKCRKIAGILVRHAVKLKVAGLEVNQRIVWKNDEGIDIVVFEENSTIIEQQFKAEFEKEIELMKMENIGITGITNKITFYDLLTKNIHFLSRFVKNEVILEALENDRYKRKFPSYINIICSRFRNAIIRRKLMYFAREYFRKNVYEKLPDECVDLILSYLSIDELLNFVRAHIPLSG